MSKTNSSAAISEPGFVIIEANPFVVYEPWVPQTTEAIIATFSDDEIMAEYLRRFSPLGQALE